jgi:Kef-type K+ transport system membrane component KefB
VLTPVPEHELLVFWVQLVVLLGAARALGALMQRWNQPPVIGELAAGVLLGPSILGRVAPDLDAWVFPGG